MKKIFLIFCLFGSLLATAQRNLNDIANVKANMKIQEESWNKGDIPGFMTYYWKNDSLKFIGSKGITYGWQKILDNYIKSYPDKTAMGMLKFTIIEASKLSKYTIYVIGKWELTKEKPVGGYFTLLWKKINNQWVIVSDHTS
jgi:hypothetical protein